MQKHNGALKCCEARSERTWNLKNIAGYGYSSCLFLSVDKCDECDTVMQGPQALRHRPLCSEAAVFHRYGMRERDCDPYVCTPSAPPTYSTHQAHSTRTRCDTATNEQPARRRRQEILPHCNYDDRRKTCALDGGEPSCSQ
mmetsp:Transcript_43938/g.72984  ORF Transcript_43938/g.72984 Transcript_43938/m.72984 type:complete len:141 (+) Transcript_43938:322-744(+)